MSGGSGAASTTSALMITPHSASRIPSQFCISDEWGSPLARARRALHACARSISLEPAGPSSIRRTARRQSRSYSRGSRTCP
jgi:hypothetical protein